MECDATVAVDVVNVAWPLPSSVPVPSEVEPSLKVTVPVGTPLPGAVDVTVAVYVTGWLNTEGLLDELTDVVVAMVFTTWGAAFPLLFGHPVLPVKLAIRVWLPTAKAAVLNDAWPVPSTGTLDAHIVAPSVKVTVPAGTPPLEVIVAVKVTDCPNTEGFGEDASFVVVLSVAVFTTWGEAASVPLLPSHPAVPVNVAVRVWLPTVSAAVLKLAWPALSTATFEAKTVAPSANVTVPVGTPPLPVTVAVNVTDWPDVEGLGEELNTVAVAPPWTVAATQLLTWKGQVRTRYP
jgi:hypothetical protein